MPKVPAENFVELLGRSGLVDKQQITAATEEFARLHNNVPADDGPALAAHFVDSGMLTRWQADKLLDGRYKSFFLGKYKLLDHLGTGGMSMVYLAEHVLMHRRVAIKVLPQSRVNDSAYLSRFYQEARAAGQLAHPNIVHTYDIDSDGKTHYIVMEYVPGRNLQEIVKRDGPLGFRRAADWIAQAADGLAYAHEAGLVHRDVKPANLLIDDRNTVKVLDLGLAYFSVEGQGSLTLANEDNVLGTADYCPPEQAINSHNVDGRADIYGLGCTLYFLLTGHPPFDEGTIAARLLAHQTQQPPSIYKDRPTAPRELVAICERMMAKNPDERFQTMTEVSAALRAWLAEAGDPGSSGRLGRFGESPSGLMRRQPPSSTPLRADGGSHTARSRLNGPLDPIQGRGGGSSVLGRELREGSGGLRPAGQSGSKTGSKSGAGQRTGEDSGELELAALPEEKRSSPAVSVAKKPGGSSGRMEKELPPADLDKNREARPSAAKPTDFSTWLSEELQRNCPLQPKHEPRGQTPASAGQLKFWLVVSAGALVVLTIGISLALFLT